MIKRLTILSLFCFFCVKSFAQDPNFSQFFASPLTMNPALTASTDASWRSFLNYRQQWLGPSAPYNTATLSFDTKLFKEYTNDNTLGIGTMLMMDNTFSGILKSNYGSLNIAYHQQIGGENNTESSIGFGFGAVYGNKQLNFNELNFESQFVSNGFNTNLPTGENGLFSMQPFISLNTGILYSLSTPKSNFDMGVSVYHFNKPKQTFLKDDLQVIPMRYVAHSSYDYQLNESAILSLNAVYQQQALLNYWSVGGSIAKGLEDDNSKTINLGLWYRNKDAVYPYIGFGIDDFQFGLTYDITVSKLNQAPKAPSSWELSISYRERNNSGNSNSSNGNGRSGSISSHLKCPWK